MCGIAGFFDPKLSIEESRQIIGRMLGTIRHRGPDATGIWQAEAVCLGHNRLSIIDLSEEANQPMHYKDLTIVYNGEIYNYIEIRDQLKKRGYRFRTSSDTEVILAAYREWGRECTKYFVGMWALVIWDAAEKVLFCSRDRFGIKPFYYIFKDGRFYFGSEYKTLKQTPLFSNQLNLSQVYLGLQLGWITHPYQSYFKVINPLPPAHNLILKERQLQLEKYWDIEPRKNFDNLNWQEKTYRFRELFLQSIRQHMRSDVEVGACLSGGLDSSSIVSSMAYHYPEKNFKTFTIYYDGTDDVDERPWAKKVINQYKNLQAYFYSPSSNDLIQYIEDFLNFQEVPVPGPSPFSQYFLMKLAAEKGVKVVIDGQGADEYLAGYKHSFYRFLAHMVRNGKIGRTLKGLKRYQVVHHLDPKEFITVLAKSIFYFLYKENQAIEIEFKKRYPYLPLDKSLVRFHYKTPFDNYSRLNEHLYYLTFISSLPNLLHYEDRNSMRFSLESRVPFLDHRVVEFVFQLEENEMIREAETKYILRQSLKGIVPSDILNRQDKKGFVTPGDTKWLRGPLKHLLEKDFSQLDMLDQKKIKEIIRRYQAGDNKIARLVWRLVMLKLWVEKI